MFSVLPLLALLTVPLLAHAQTTTNNCTIFTWDGLPSYILNSTAVRISAGQICAGKTNNTNYCSITAAGDIQSVYSYNISRSIPSVAWNTATGSISFIHSLVQAAVNGSLNGTAWPNSAIGSIDTTQSLAPRTAGYIQFEPYKRCFVGKMSNCTGTGENGAGIEVCAPVYHTLKTSTAAVKSVIMDGAYSIVQVSSENATQLRDPYANQSAGSPNGAVGQFVIPTGLLVGFVIMLGTLLI